MELKTKVNAEEGRHFLHITREFELPVDLLFRAYAEPELLEQWMGTKVLSFEARRHGGWQFSTSNPEGQVVFAAHGVFHEFLPPQKIVRTFEMDNAPFDVQLEFLDFEALTHDSSRLTIQMVFRSVENRDRLLKMPFAYGLSMAHDRLQEVLANHR